MEKLRKFVETILAGEVSINCRNEEETEVFFETIKQIPEIYELCDNNNNIDALKNATMLNDKTSKCYYIDSDYDEENDDVLKIYLEVDNIDFSNYYGREIWLVDEFISEYKESIELDNSEIVKCDNNKYFINKNTSRQKNIVFEFEGRYSFSENLKINKALLKMLNNKYELSKGKIVSQGFDEYFILSDENLQLKYCKKLTNSYAGKLVFRLNKLEAKPELLIDMLNDLDYEKLIQDNNKQLIDEYNNTDKSFKKWNSLKDFIHFRNCDILNKKQLEDLYKELGVKNPKKEILDFFEKSRRQEISKQEMDNYIKGLKDTLKIFLEQ